MEPARKKVLHIITGLYVGGAEMMLLNLLGAMDRSSFDILVISLTDDGLLGEKIKSLNIPVVSLGLRRVWNPIYMLRIISCLRCYRPDVIQTWMYSSDLLGGIAAKLAGGFPVVWGIHHSSLDPKVTSRSMIWKAKLCALFSSYLTKRIVCCSNATEKFHHRLGYKEERLVVIYNGFNMERYKPDPAAGASVRRELGILPETFVIGLVGRFDPQKDQHNFIQAVRLFHQKNPDARYLLCGHRISWDNSQLTQWIDEADIRNKVYLLGRREDVPRIMASLDIAVSASNTEAFPLVVGEAMAAGIPCVVTDVGDSALIVGNAGWVVKPKDPEAMAATWQEIIGLSSDERKKIGEQARQRIEKHFTLQLCARNYEKLYSKIATGNA